VETSSLLAGIALLVAAVYSSAGADNLKDYPTAARVDYVFGCMKANGETQHTLDQCSCSIDIIASILPYDLRGGIDRVEHGAGAGTSG
jgi:hypothetical protein